MYHAINRAWYVQSGVRAPRVLLTLPTLLLTLLAVGMCLGVVLAVGALLSLQVGPVSRPWVPRVPPRPRCRSLPYV